MMSIFFFCVTAVASLGVAESGDESSSSSSSSLQLPATVELRSAGSFAHAVSNEPNVPIRYCGDALIVPPQARARTAEAVPCPQENSLSLPHALFDRFLNYVTRAPKQNQVRWGTATPAKVYNAYGQQSGFGFEGVRHAAPVPTNGSVFLLGTLTHFNHAVFGWVETVDLLLNVSLAQRVATLKIPLRVHETPNEDSCPYKSDAFFGCSDRVWLLPKHVALPPPFAHAQRRSPAGLLVGGAADPLVLMMRGVKLHPSQPDSELALSFVSQERRNTYAYLYGAFVHSSEVNALSKTSE